jgi:hypothetical protein
MGRTNATGDGLKAYYRAKIEELELQIKDKSHNLRRLEAQRNELNAHGGALSAPKLPEGQPRERRNDGLLVHHVSRTGLHCLQGCLAGEGLRPSRGFAFVPCPSQSAASRRSFSCSKSQAPMWARSSR